MTARLQDGACIARLEYARGGLTEWWTATEEGLEQGWTVASRPDGDDGEAWVVSGLDAWDADGVRLPARFEATPDGMRVIVDDSAARYPIVVDPVYTIPSTTLSAPDGGRRRGASRRAVRTRPGYAVSAGRWCGRSS